MKTEKSYWTRLCERIVRSPQEERKAMDADANDRALTQLRDDDPAYRALMDHAFNQVENNMAVAFGTQYSVDERRDFMNRAAGVQAFITAVEDRRAELKEALLEKQRLETARKK